MTHTKNVEILGVPGVARQLTVNDTSASTQLTKGAYRISMRAVTADVRFLIQPTSGTADTNSHFIAAGERLDFAVPSGGYICYIRAGSDNGTLEVTELV